MRFTPMDLLWDMIGVIEIELSYAAAEIRMAEHSGEELARASEHIASAIALLRKLGAQAPGDLAGERMLEV